MLLGLVLLASWCAVWLAARRALRWADASSPALALAVSVGVMVGIPATITRVSENLTVSVIITALLAAGVYALLGRSLATASGNSDPAPVRPSALGWAWAGIIAALSLWTIIDEYVFDEEVGHIPISNMISHGLVPPQTPWLPGNVLLYHYGFDVLVGEVHAMTGLSSVRSIDVVSVLCLLLLLWLAFEVGAKLAGRTGGTLALLLVPLGSGFFLAFVAPGAGSFTLRLPLLPAAWYDHWTDYVPPSIGNFFQHPMGIGMPIALAVLLLATSDERAPATFHRRFLIAGLLLGALSLMQFVFFMMLGAALGLTVLLRYLRRRDRRALLRELLILALALPIAYGLGGFLEARSGQRVMEFGKSHFEDPFFPNILRHLAVFGMPLVAVVWSMFRLNQEGKSLRWALIAASAAGFLIPNLMVYTKTWDIVKFYTVAVFFGSVLLSDALATWIQRRGALRNLALALVALSTFSGWTWLLRMSVLDGRFGVPRYFGAPPIELGEAVTAKLCPLMRPTERVFSTNMDMGRAGLLTPGVMDPSPDVNWFFDLNGAKEMFERAQRMRHTLDPAEIAWLKVRYLVLSPGDIASLRPEAKQALQDPARFEALGDVHAGGEMRSLYRVRGP
ncbi:MAG: hypothetical protein U1E65_03145 [Myxococcota bacterium]